MNIPHAKSIITIRKKKSIITKNFFQTFVGSDFLKDYFEYHQSHFLEATE